MLNRAEDSSTYVIYKQILEMGEYIELDTLRAMVEDEADGFALEFATDAVLYVAPRSDAHVLTASRHGFVEETVDGNIRYVGETTLPGYFWDEEGTRPRYKWEPPKPLRMMHRPRSILTFNVPHPKELTWNSLATDGPELAPNGNWIPVAEPLLEVSAVNIDGPPGTGKTSLLRTLISLVVQRHGDDSFLALAPTNVAACNIGEMGKSIKTIASFQRQWQDAQERGGKAMKRLLEKMSQVRYLFVDEISMMHSWLYGLFHSVRRTFPSIRVFFVGDFKQLEPVLDVWKGDYKGSSALHHLCDGNRLQLSHCRRSDRTLFDLYMSADDVDPARFPISEVTQLNVAYTHITRKRVNAKCMREFSQEAEETRVIPANPKDHKSQDMTLFVGIPLVCWKTKKEKKKVVFAHSEIWFVVELGEENMQLQRKLEEVDREAGKTQEDMPTLEMPYSELQGRFRPGYCITVHMSQGKTFRERFTIHDWFSERMEGRGRYVALSRGKTTDLVQITPRDRKRSLGGDDFEYDGEANAEDSDFEYDGEANESDDESDFEYDGE